MNHDTNPRNATVEVIGLVYPDGDPIHLHLNIGIGTLKLGVGGDRLLSGTITYNIEEWSPVIRTSGNQVTVRQGDEHFNWENFPDPRRYKNAQNDWNLLIGAAKPLDLHVQSGVAPSQLDLGGLPLVNFAFKTGVGNATLNFGQMNPRQATFARISSGVGNLRVTDLLNLNARTFQIESGTGSLNLDLNGSQPLTQDTSATISSGVGSITLNLPADTPTRIIAKNGIGNIHTNGDFTMTGRHIYETHSERDRPRLTINVQSGMGTITLNAPKDTASRRERANSQQSPAVG